MLSIPGIIPVKIHPIFWLFSFLIGWLNSFSFLGTLVWVVVILISVLIHEYGHALTAMVFGQKARIDLVAMGGVTQRQGRQLKLWQEFIITLNGPLAGFLLFILAYKLRGLIVNHPSTLLTYTVEITVYANLFWTLVNLLPIQPLDGGRLLSIVLEGIFGLKGLKIALFLSMILAVLFGVAFFALQAFLAGSLFLMLAFENFRAWKGILSIREQDQNFNLQQLLQEAEKNLKQGNLFEAQVKFQRLRELSEKGVIYETATQHFAEILSQQGKFKDAYDLLLPLRSKLNPEGLLLLHRAAYQSGELHEAIDLGNKVYQNYPNSEVALTNALCHSLLGEVRPAIGWLQCALKQGIPNLHVILSKQEFDAIRGNPMFQDFQRKISD